MMTDRNDSQPIGHAVAASARARLIPDLDDELTASLAQAEELLLEVTAWEEDDAGTTWSAPLAGGQALAALRRIWDAVAPTQGDWAVAAGRSGRLLAPDGKWEHMPLRLVCVADSDVEDLAAAAALFGAPDAPEHVREAPGNGADIACRASGDEACTRLVATMARVAGLLDLAPDRDTEVLAAVLAGVDPGADVVLSVAGEAAYWRFADRANGMWSGGDPLTRYLY
jgi:hypothetical protein